MVVSTDRDARSGPPADVFGTPAGRPLSHERHRSPRPRQAVRRPSRRRRRLVRGRGGRDLRHPRPERRREDHHRRIDRRPARAGLRHDQRPRARPSARPRRAPQAARRPAPGERAARPDQGLARRSTCTPPSTRDPADWRALSRISASPTSANTAFRKLSGGQKQRLSIALALVGNPRIAILDELTTGLDPQARRDTWQLIEDVRARGVTHRPRHPLHGGGGASRRPARRHRRRPHRRARHAGRASSPGSTPSSASGSGRLRRSTTPLLTALPEVRSVEPHRARPWSSPARATCSMP